MRLRPRFETDLKMRSIFTKSRFHRTAANRSAHPFVGTKTPHIRGFHANARVVLRFTKGDAWPHACVHFCRHGLRRTVSLHFLRAVHNLLLSCYLQPGRGDASLRPLRWGLDVSRILQSCAEDRCNPPSSPLSTCANPGTAGVLAVFAPQCMDPSMDPSMHSPPSAGPHSLLIRSSFALHSDARTWHLRCSPIAVLVSLETPALRCPH
jgi:hypothetical protein